MEKLFIHSYKTVPHNRPLFKRLNELRRQDESGQGSPKQTQVESQPVENLGVQSLDIFIAEDEVTCMDEEDENDLIVGMTTSACKSSSSYDTDS
jgi:hypothetical protein